MCFDNQTSWTKYGWFDSPPISTANCLWMNVQNMRKMLGHEEVDKSIEKSISILTENPEIYTNVNVVWERFGNNREKIQTLQDCMLKN